MIKIKTNGSKAWVTFTFAPRESVERVSLSGLWNDWKDEELKQKKCGEFYITKILNVGEKYQFGYKINGSQWMEDDMCETEVSPFGSKNSILQLRA